MARELSKFLEDELNIVNGGDLLIKALKNELKLWLVDRTNKIICRNNDYVAIHLNDPSNPIHFFKRTAQGSWEKYNCNHMKPEDPEAMFLTKEEAEKYVLERLRKGFGKEYIDSTDFSRYNELFEKYNIEKPDYWKDLYRSKLQELIKGLWENIAFSYNRIQEQKEVIKEKERYLTGLINQVRASEDSDILEGIDYDLDLF